MHTIHIPSIRTILGRALHMFTRRNVVMGILLLVSYAFAYNAGHDAGRMYVSAYTNDPRVLNLIHACVPEDTGGGVSQCAQPSRGDLALSACLRNDAYIAAHIEDTFHLLAQCLDDWRDAHPGHPFNDSTRGDIAQGS